MSFPSFQLWAVYPRKVIHHEEFIFIIFVSAVRERHNFQQLSKLIELQLIPTI